MFFTGSLETLPVSVCLCQTCEKSSKTQWIAFGKQFLTLNALQAAVLLHFCWFGEVLQKCYSWGGFFKIFYFFSPYMSRYVSLIWFFFETGVLSFFGRTEGDAWIKSFSIIFQINEKMFPIKISIWLISSWLIRKETRKSGVLGCIQCKSGEESVTGKNISASKDAGCFL